MPAAIVGQAAGERSENMRVPPSFHASMAKAAGAA